MADRPALRLFDTLSQSKRAFRPAQCEVTLYVCGVTPYDTAHLGHGFTYASFDVLIRYLQFLGHSVRYIQNVTDIDDPLFDKAAELGISYRDLAAEQTERHLTDMRALNVLPAAAYPHASREIPEMIALVERLIRGGNAYVVEDRVYFSIATDPEYGRLSHCDRAAMIELARERGGDPDDPLRRDPLDFVLWRPSRAGEPHEASPWGPGLPGWHLECSAMALKYLGSPIDIHGGGRDLIFPHHESEIAQSEQATGRQPFAHFWLHTGMVHLGGEKMSKSLGNMVFVRDLMAEHGSDAVRLYISGCHYRADLHYDADRMRSARELARHVLAAATERPSDGRTDDAGSQAAGASYRRRFLQRMSDDLDTPGAITVLRELADAIQARRSNGQEVDGLPALLRQLGEILGLRLESI